MQPHSAGASPAPPASRRPPARRDEPHGPSGSGTERTSFVAGAPRAGKHHAGRLQFLDALRGIAALAVAMQHSAEFIWRDYFRFSLAVFRPGEFGVVLFFMCSGFIIPASVERHASLIDFWIGRVFRLFPLYLFTIFLAVELHHVRRFAFSADVVNHPRRALLTNLTMVQNMLGGHLLIVGATWTLAYEVVFYLFVSLLFLAGLHRRSVPTAVTALLLAGAIGSFLPAAMVTSPTRATLGSVLCTMALASFVILRMVPSRPLPRVFGVGLVVVIVALVMNRPEPMWQALLLFATMFVGTVLYRYTTGEVTGRTAGAVLGVGVAAVLAVHALHLAPHREPTTGALLTWRSESLTFVVAYLVFGLGLLLRFRAFPRWLVFLGTISYSVYMMHTIVIYAVPWWGASQWATWLRWVGLTVLSATVTYHVIEKPAINRGRVLARRVRQRRSVHTVG